MEGKRRNFGKILVTRNAMIKVAGCNHGLIQKGKF